jgi:hypothetical protein
MAVFAVGATAAASASAAIEEQEAGFLPLETLKTAITFSGTGGTVIFNIGGEKSLVPCNSSKISGTLGAAGQTHVILGMATLTLAGCKKEALACNTEGAEKETVVIPVDLHLLNVLSAEKRLQPGIALILLSNSVWKCGTAVLEFRGVAKGLITKVSLTAEVSVAGLSFVAAGETCDPLKDPSAKECKENFESASLEATSELTLSKAVLIDD